MSYAKPITIDLTSPQGNCFFILGKARELMKTLGYNNETNELIIKDMMSSDYNHLVRTFHSYFDDYVEIKCSDEQRDEIFSLNLDNNDDLI